MKRSENYAFRLWMSRNLARYKLANDYDRLAERAEDRASHAAPGPSPRAKEGKH
jgi:hypothetical protein